MLAFIGGLFAGVFGILGNLLGKKSDYLLEFEDKESNTPKQESTTVTAPAPETTKTETPKEAKAKLSKAKKSASSETPKAAKAKKEEPTAPKVAAPQPPVTNTKVSEKPAELVLFAPNYLMPKPTTKRRRAGANMAMFRGMAKDMNLPR